MYTFETPHACKECKKPLSRYCAYDLCAPCRKKLGRKLVHRAYQGPTDSREAR